MTEQTKKAIIAGLKADLANASDNLHRAKAAFGSSPELLGEQYGQSGQTRQQIIDGYQRWFDRANDSLIEASAALDAK